MIILALAIVFVATLVTGPAWEDWRNRRRVQRDFPVAKVVFLLPSVCDPAD